jgi:lipopolysaccharide/colanic/teichoic acid biosynthesis glycosyltransferase
MSLVGPRPERSDYVQHFKDVVPKYLDRHRVKTGMTGWAQVNGLRGGTSLEDRIAYDLYYIEHWSMTFDIKILLRTIREIFWSRSAE